MNEEHLAVLAHKQVDLWDADSSRYPDIGVPFAYIMWAYGRDVEVARVELGEDPADWPFEIANSSRRLGGEPSAVTTVAMGTMIVLEANEDDAKSLLSVANGVPPSALPGTREHLISRMRTAGSDGLGRIIGAPVLDDGCLGSHTDSGYTDLVVSH